MSEFGRFRTSLTFLTASAPDSGFPSPRSSIIDLTSSTNLWPTHLGFLGILKAVNFFETLWIAAAEAERIRLEAERQKQEAAEEEKKR